jgi:hypothetical protein
MGTADLHPVPVRMPVRKLPHLLRSMHPGMRTVRMSETRRTRTGYRYGVVTADEIVRQAGGDFTLLCQEEGCWLIVQGGQQAMAEHQRVVHGTYPKLRPIR